MKLLSQRGVIDLVHSAIVRVDVLTAVHDEYAGFVVDAWRSLRGQSHQDWTWLVQVDGPPEGVLASLERCGAADDPRVRLHAHQTHEGPAVTRNIALGRASASLVQNLDADDELEPDAIALLADALTEHESAGFAVGHARDLMPDGRLVDHPLPVEAGVLPPRALQAAWSETSERYRLPVHPAGVLWRRHLLVRIGGWAALRGMEDTALLMAASALEPGVLVDRPTLRHRKHPAQASARTSKFAGGGGRRLRSFTNAWPSLINGRLISIGCGRRRPCAG